MTSLTKDQQAALAQWLLAAADDELILAHRNSEWTGHAPILEEDIAFANIAQDELGHAILWYDALQSLGGPDADQLVYFRSADEFRNVQMVELPKGDWAFSILRQYLFDAWELARCSYLMDSRHATLVDIAAKIRREEIYHQRHSSAWVVRLGQGTEESHGRLQWALNGLWPYTAQLFRPMDAEALLHDAGLAPTAATLYEAWIAAVRPRLEEAALSLPAEAAAVTPARTEHSDHLAELLADLQAVARSDPRAAW